MISFERYRAVFAHPELRQTFLASVLGRLPIGVSGLAILLLVQTSTGSFVQGGAAAGCYVAGLATLAPAIGRVIDRYGPRRVLLACGFLFPAALVGLVLAVRNDAAPLTLAFAAAAGASFPPISVSVRTYFRRRLGSDPLLATAYSVDSIFIEVVFIVGPLLVALFVAVASAAAAVLFAAACALAGTLMFVRAPALRTWFIEERTSSSLLGPLADRRFALLVVVVLFFAVAFGFLEIGVTAYATEAGDAALAGVLLGLMSLGSAVGGIAYGGRTWRAPLARQFSVALAIVGAGLSILVLEWTPWPFAALCVLAGVAMAPGLIIQSMLTARMARAEHATEAFTWTTSALLAGVGIGLAAGGALLEVFTSRAAFAGGATAALAAAAGAALFLRR